MAEPQTRQPFVNTAGREVYLYDHDIAAVVSISTQKHGPCLLLSVRGSEDVWIRDDERHRRLLSIPPAAVTDHKVRLIGARNRQMLRDAGDAPDAPESS